LAHHSRCNWCTLQSTATYDDPAMIGPLGATSRISQSEFLHVTRVGGRLTIRVDTRTAAPRRFRLGARGRVAAGIATKSADYNQRPRTYRATM